MPDGPVHFNPNNISSSNMRKDSQSSLNGESPGIIISEDKPKRGQLSKKVSFRKNNNNNNNNANVVSDSDSSGQSVDDEVFEAVIETKQLLKTSTVNVQRTQSHREVRSNSTGAGQEESDARAGHSALCKRPKRSASFRDGLRQGESYQILMLGAVGVGKTSLVRQFQQANHCGSVVIKISNVYGDNCKRADDAQLVIFDHPAADITAEMALSCCAIDAYVIVYSVTDRSSFKTAQNILKVISTSDSKQPSNKAAILVGNKVDLVRKRVISTEEGKRTAVSSGCKFIETSDWIDYNVGELFNGVLAQIRLRSDVASRQSNCGGSRRNGIRQGYRRSKTLGAKSWGVLKDFLNLINKKVVSCDDLQVL